KDELGSPRPAVGPAAAGGWVVSRCHRNRQRPLRRREPAPAGRAARPVARSRIATPLPEWILDAVAAVAADGGAALFPGVEPAVSCAAAGAVLGTPRIDHLGAARRGSRQQAKNACHDDRKAVAHLEPPRW